MTQAGASPMLKSSRHAIHLTGDLREPARALQKYAFVTTYRKQTDRMRSFVGEADSSRERLDLVVQAFRQLLAAHGFRDMLIAEGLAVMPAALVDRIAGKQPMPRAMDEQSLTSSQHLVGGVCSEVLDLLCDCVVPPKMFGLLRQVVPRRQVEIARLMIALERVKLNTARVFIILTPRSQLADPSRPQQQFVGIESAQLAAMETELTALSTRFQSAAERNGTWNLELVAARGYIYQLLESAKLVRYLAKHFPQRLAEFQTLLDFSTHIDPLVRRRKRPGKKANKASCAAPTHPAR